MTVKLCILLTIFSKCLTQDISMCYCDEGCSCTESCGTNEMEYSIWNEEIQLCPNELVCCLTLDYPQPEDLNLDPSSSRIYKENIMLIAKDVEKEVREAAELIQKLRGEMLGE
ncbi:uncharacterized protein LOC130447412 isoform X1 [Diorhabda sublineata]|uniref:uncharacterized protein LOC130447412 isoform X1 n=1 Tax=Diorhabda sublineata TaxID=1163346 RepID=UPI0024E1535B|nr:uncharacterized protein LOC130447412 isoform X1 [Diorhabda sublineata]